MDIDWNNMKVQAALLQLAGRGFDPEDVRMYSKSIIIKCIVPVAPAEAAILLHAAEVQETKMEERRIHEQEAATARRFKPFVGRVLCKFDGACTTTGSCVLIGPAGLTVTARHGLYYDEELQTKRKKKLISPHTIIVKYPNASGGRAEFLAMIRHENAAEDLAILAPLHEWTRALDYFSSWSLGERQACTRVILISFPDLMDEEFPGRKVQDQPTCDSGSLALVTQRRIISTYRGFSGSSGGLVLKVDAEDGLHGIGIHLSMAHHTDLLKVWNADQLSLLNINLGRKGCYGVATRAIGSYLESFFNKHDKDLGGAQFQRAARILERLPSLNGVVAVVDFADEVINDSLLLGEDEYKENKIVNNETVESIKGGTNEKMRNIRLGDASVQLDNLSEDDCRALRGSRLALLPAPVLNEKMAEPRVPHPGGPVATNKAAALAKFLQRKLETSSGSLGLDPALVEAAVENAKATLHGLSSSAAKVRHVETFSDSEKEMDAEGPLEAKDCTGKEQEKGKGGKKNSWKQIAKSGESTCKGPLKKSKH